MKSIMHCRLLGCVLVLFAFAGAADGAGRPNVILIMADDVSAREFGVYGHPEHRTPNLDRMAREGVWFRTAWATPICSPSRAELMTGRYAHRTRWYHNNMKPEGTAGLFAREHLTIGAMMRAAGYRTAIAGKWQLPGEPPDYGFDEHFLWEDVPSFPFDGQREGPSMAVPGRAARYWHPSIVRNGTPVKTGPDDYGPDLFAAFADDFAGRGGDRPFFLYYAMLLPHISWDFERNRHDYLPPPALDAAGNRIPGKRSPPTLRANVEYIDALIGRIEAALKQRGLLENTIILFTSDNGTAGYGKGSVHQERGPRVPFIAYGPGVVKPTGTRNELVDLSDVLPTLADLAGHTLPADYPLDGRSFAWILRGGTGTPRDHVFSPYATRKLVRTPEWILDGQDRLWFCGDKRDESGYEDRTKATDAASRAALKQLRAIAAQYPIPPEGDPLREAYRQFEQRQRKQKKEKAD